MMEKLSSIFDRFREIWVVDAEFIAEEGEHPVPVCLVAEEIRSGRVIRLWSDDMTSSVPYSLDEDVLFVAYYAVAELMVHRSLNWEVPVNVLDPYVEFCREINGKGYNQGVGLLSALAYYGISDQFPFDKDVMRDLIIAGGPWSALDQERIVEYCRSDVIALKNLFFAMAENIDLDRALLRGRYMSAVSAMEWSGIPMDVKNLKHLLGRKECIRRELTQEVDRESGVFIDGCFCERRFGGYLSQRGIAWPRHPGGRLKLDQKTFDERSDTHTALKPIRDLRRTNSSLQNNRLSIGSDGRNRTSLRPFCSRTGRNQPSNSKFIFGQPAWWRGYIRADPDHALAYIDWDQQEFGIAAALSGDVAMRSAYQSGDPYLAFAKQVGAVPSDATKESHKEIRDQYKATVLAVQYGMAAKSLAERTGLTIVEAQCLLEAHRFTYQEFWTWSDAVLNTALWRGWIESVFGWRQHLPQPVNERSVRNFPMQANGAEMMRLATIMAVDAGIEIVAPVHDAVLIHVQKERLHEQVDQMREIMVEASRQVLDGFEIGAGADVFAYPDRFMDARGVAMWSKVQKYAA